MEITICLLPLAIQAVAIQNLLQTLPPEAVSLHNQPHVSLFQMKVKKEFLDDLQQVIWNMGSPQETLAFTTKGILTKYANIALDLDPQSEAFVPFKESVIEAIKNFRSSKLMAQIHVADLSDQEKEWVASYGIYWGVGDQVHKSHVTLRYNSNLPSPLEVPEELTSLTFDRLAIGRIGHDGNLDYIYWEVPLKTLYGNQRHQDEER